MGGKGSGGRRLGSGRPKKSDSERFVDGNAGHRGRVLAHPSAPPAAPPPVDEFDAPDTLTMEERMVWLRQAPHAFANRTLTKSSAMAFERYCRLVVEEGVEAKSSGHGGSNHRGMVKTLNAYELQFQLTPACKPMADAAPAVPVVAEQKRAYW